MACCHRQQLSRSKGRFGEFQVREGSTYSAHLEAGPCRRSGPSWRYSLRFGFRMLRGLDLQLEECLDTCCRKRITQVTPLL